MHHRFLYVALTLAAVALALLGSHRFWERMGSPAIELDEGAPYDMGQGALLEEALGAEEGNELGAFASELPSREAPTPQVSFSSLTDLANPTLRHRMCRHDDAVWSAVEEQLRAAPSTDDVAHSLADASARGCLLPVREATCAWALSALDQHATERLQVAFSLLAHCDDARAFTWLDRADTPPRSVVEFMLLREALHDPPLRLPMHLTAAVTEALTSGRDWELAALAEVLSPYDDEEAQQILLQLYEASPTHAREPIGLAMHYAADERGRAMHHEACARSPEGALRCRDADFASEVSSASFDLGFALRRHPERRNEALSLLEICASNADQLIAERCFRRLANLDRARASLAAPTRTRLAALFEETIVAFPTRTSIDASLDAQGLALTVRPNIEVVLPIDALVARGVAFSVAELMAGDPARATLALLDAVGFTDAVVELDGPLVHIYRQGRVVDIQHTPMVPVLAIGAFAQLADANAQDALCTFAWADQPYLVCAETAVLAQLEANHFFVADTTD